LAAPAQAQHYLRLVDRLDRPSDGYCLDVLGAGGQFRTDMPLMAHNCKADAAPDGLVDLRADGTLYMPAFDACVTAMGVNRSVLPGAVLILKPCGARVPFLNADGFQRFDMVDGQMRLRGQNVCLRVGASSDRTFSASHTWRTLFMDSCSAPNALSRWALTRPNS